jgi:Tfp pilus assembly protein PilZ
MELTVPLVIITEIVLPQMSGLELLKQVKQDPRTATVPVIISTALKDPSYRQACEMAGCASYLVQPLGHNQLFEAVQKATESAPRRYIRLDTAGDVTVSGTTVPGGERKEKVSDISEHGMFVGAENPLPYGTTASFILYLDRALAWGIRVEGTVIYSVAAGNPQKTAGMGVKFTQIRHEDREAISAFIRNRLLEGISSSSEKLLK